MHVAFRVHRNPLPHYVFSKASIADAEGLVTLKRHVNANFGKGASKLKFAYTFLQGIDTNYGVEYMRSAISTLIKTAEYDVETSVREGTPTFVGRRTEADAVAAISAMWENLLA